MTTITPIQWRRALALASAHRHGWADWAQGYHAGKLARRAAYAAWRDSSSTDNPSDLEWVDIEDASIAARVPVPVPSTWDEAVLMFARDGVSGPCGLGESPSPKHTTGTGRTSWHVASDGTVDISISRPLYPLGSCCEARGQDGYCDCGVVVLRSLISPAGEVHTEVLGDAQERHHEALEICLKAITIVEGE